MKLRRPTYIVIAATALFGSCIKPFNPAVTSVNANILVVEGFINTGGDTTKFTLSHTVTINNKNSSVPETGAAVTVEDAKGTSYPVPETAKKGSYVSKGALALTSGTQYRLRIKTAGGKTYLSDLVDSKITPPIDSIGYNFTSDGIGFYANAHDDAGQTRYYKYGYSEAWEFRSKLPSNFISNGKIALNRSASQMVDVCFGSDSSTNIFLNSTAALTKDVVYQHVFNTQSDTSEKFEMRYSLLLSQQALTKDGYNFWQNLKTNTEQLGSIFDAQPSAISGNIHNISNATEPVIGFISAGTIQKKRIYINGNTLPKNFVAGYPAVCNVYNAIIVDSVNSPRGLPLGTLWAYPAVIRLPSSNRILTADMPDGPFTLTSAICADCTLRGTHNPPAFWKP